MKEKEAYGVKFVVSGETFDEYKGTLQDQLEEAYKEIDRLNNIINELEKTLAFDNEQVKAYNVEHPEAGGKIPNFPSVYLDKLKELKEKE